MVVYIDVLIFINIIINYCILSVTRKFLHIKTSELRIILSAGIGSLFSLTALDTNINIVLSYIIKLICSIVMCLVAYKNTNFKYIIRNIISVFAFSMIFSSVMILFYQTVKPHNMAIINDNVYFQVNPLFLILLSIVSYLIIITVQKLIKANIDNTLVNLTMTIDNRDFSCIGKIDTGCSVVEPFTGTPVIITESEVLNDFNINTPRIIPYKGFNSHGLLYGIKANSIHIDGKEMQTEAYIAITNEKIDPDFQAIINHKITR